MSRSRAPWALAGSLLFLVAVPGSVAALVPYWLTGWRAGPPFFGLALGRVIGMALMGAGLLGLLDSFARFVFVGRGTPAPLAPPTRLVVVGQYRFVRNPMYVAVVTIVLGQGLVLARLALLEYAALLLGLFHLFVILHEEPALRSRFGDSYERYCRHVRRWWPRLTPWRD